MTDEGEVVQEEVKPEEMQAGEVVPAESAPVIEGAPAEPSVPAASEPPPVEAAPAAPVAPPVPTPAPPPASTPLPPTNPSPHFGHYSVKEAQELSKHAYQEVFEHKAEKILAYIQSHGKISRDETARLLFVSNNSAYLYLKRLVKEGKVRPTGRGKLVRYVRS